MRRPICWVLKLEDGVKKKIMVTFSGNKIRWKSKRSDEAVWKYDVVPDEQDWDDLLKLAEARYARRRIPYSHLELIHKKRDVSFPRAQE